MGKDKETPEIRREKMRQEELKNPASSIKGSNLADLVGSLSWKGFGILILILIIGGGYFSLKFSSPLKLETIVSSDDNNSVVIGIDNNGFRDVVILDVSVNNNEKPLETRLEVSNASQGFNIMDDYNTEEAKEYAFHIDEVTIKAGTSSKDDEIYGISIIHNEEIYNIHIEYRHFGMTFNDTVYLNKY